MCYHLVNNKAIDVLLTVKMRFSITASSRGVSPNKCDADGKPEINLAAETGNANIFELTDTIESPTANLCLWLQRDRRSCLWAIETTTDNRK